MRRLVVRAAFVIVGLLFALVAVEVAMRVFKPYKTHRAARELREFREGGDDVAAFFTIDPDIGFRPRLGTSAYTRFGTRPNEYSIDKPAGKRRALFIGDSVTAHGGIDQALRRLYGDDRFEYWNAGVDSFNTLQELAFYRRYNALIEPDEVVLTFHLNDFETTPVTFVDDDGRLIVYAPRRPARELNLTLFEHSHIYRMYVGLVTDRESGYEAIRAEVHGALAEMKELVKPPARLTVVVFPFMQERSLWREEHRRAHDDAVAILDQLQIRHFELLDVLDQALRDGIDVQEDPGDTWHPSPAMADRIAQYLHARGLFAD